MESSLKDEIEAGGSLLNHAKAKPLSVMAKALHLTGSWYPCSSIWFLKVLRWSTGPFVLSKASIYCILNFVGRGKCNTLALNEDFIFYTRVSMETRARTFTASFMWLSSYWMS